AAGEMRSTALTVTTTSSGAPALDSWGSGPPGAGPAATTARTGAATIYSRGYKEEMEHLAYSIKMRDQGMARDREDLQPRCHGRAAMADAIIALSSNQAFRTQKREEFPESWFGTTGSLPQWDEEMERSVRRS